MFGNNYKITLVAGAEGALPTATVEECTMLDSALGEVVDLFSSEVAHVGSGRTVGKLALVYGTAVGVNRVLSGSFNFNPLKA